MAVILTGRACWTDTITPAGSSHQYQELACESRHILGLPSTASVTFQAELIFSLHPKPRDDGMELTGDGYLRTPRVLRW